MCERQVCRASVSTSEEQASEQVSSQSHATGCFRVCEQPDKNTHAQVQIILSRARLTQTSYVDSLGCMPPPNTGSTVMEARPKNVSTTLPHVKPTLTDPAAAGRRPRAVCHCQRAPTTPSHWQCVPAAPLPRAVTASAHSHADTLPVRTRCTAAFVLSLPARTH